MIVFPGLTVLVLEQNGSAGSAIESALARRGATLLRAMTAAGALELLESIAIDLVVLSVPPERSSGLVQRLASAAPAAAVLVLTSSALPHHLRGARSRASIDAVLPHDCPAAALESTVVRLTAARARSAN